MGVYEYIDPQTGQGYNFTIAGDAPSNTEFAPVSYTHLTLPTKRIV